MTSKKNFFKKRGRKNQNSKMNQLTRHSILIKSNPKHDLFKDWLIQIKTP